MIPTGFEAFRAGREHCPSEVKLWRLHLGELKGGEATRLRHHTATCPACGRDLARCAGGLACYPEIDWLRVLSAVRTRHPR